MIRNQYILANGMYTNHFLLPVEGDKDSFSYEDYNVVLTNESLEFFLFRSQMALLSGISRVNTVDFSWSW